jgi:soluble lytic murein transglycosylase-like protein
MKILLILLIILLPWATAYAEEGVAGISVSLDKAHEAKQKQKDEIDQYITDFSLLYDVDPDLVRAVMSGESEGVIRAFNENDNGTTDHGLMQINSCNHEWLEKELGITDWYDPRQNIQAGTYMLSLLSDKYGDLHKVLMAYNMGEGRMRELWSEGITSSKYSCKVMGKFNQLKEGVK